MKRNLIKEIELKRVRTNDFLGDTPIIHDLKEYESEINSASCKEIYNDNIYQFIPVKVCSAFESFFRFSIEKLIDTKKIDSQRVLKIDEIKNFSCNVLVMQEFLKNKISLGEIASKLVSLTSMRKIHIAFSLLLDCDFLKELITFKIKSNPAIHNLEQTYWEQNYSTILKDLNAMYEVRNITCHEFSFVINIEKPILHRYLKHGISFLERVSAFLYYRYYTTQIRKQKISENTLAKRDFIEMENQLDELVERVCNYSGKVWYDTVYLSTNLKDEIFYWKRHRRRIVKSNCWIYERSKSYHLFYWREMEIMTFEMIKTLNSRYEYLVNEVEKKLKIQKFI